MGSNGQYLFWPYPMVPERPRNKHEKRFWEIHAIYPEIYVRVDSLAQNLILRGCNHYSSDAFFHALRFHSQTTMDPPDPWKMNDNYTPYYARYWLQNHEPYWGFFELRKVKGEYPYIPFEYGPDGQGFFA